MSKKYAIVAGQFNESIVNSLLGACIDELTNAGIKKENISVTYVPGAFEIPLTADLIAQKNPNIAAIICLGAIIKGETPHFDYVCAQASSGIMQVSLKTKIPVIFGVLTTNTVEQAQNRSGLKHGNKGRDSARSAIHMSKVVTEINKV